MAAALRSDWVEERRCRPAMRIGTEQETQRAAAGQESQAEPEPKRPGGKGGLVLTPRCREDATEERNLPRVALPGLPRNQPGQMRYLET